MGGGLSALLPMCGLRERPKAGGWWHQGWWWDGCWWGSQLGHSARTPTWGLSVGLLTMWQPQCPRVAAQGTGCECPRRTGGGCAPFLTHPWRPHVPPPSQSVGHPVTKVNPGSRRWAQTSYQADSGPASVLLPRVGKD